MALPQRALTLDEFLKLPEEKPALEHVEGSVRQKVAAKPRRSAVQSYLDLYFNNRGMPSKIARAFPDMHVTFGGQSRVSDLVVFRWPRIPRDARGKIADECRYPPNVAIEIISPGQSIGELTQDCEWCVANGVELALVVLPTGERVGLFLPKQPWRELRGDDTIDFGAILPEARLSVRELYTALDAD